MYANDVSFLNCNLRKSIVLSNGLPEGPCKFTELTNPLLAFLRLQDHTIAIYTDDLFTKEDPFEDCLHSVIQAMKLFRKTGFAIHPEKSYFVPFQVVTYLWFIMDSEKIIVYLLDDKKEKLYEKFQFSFLNKGLKIRDVASFIG